MSTTSLVRHASNPFASLVTAESREATPPPPDLQRWQEELDTPLENDILDESVTRTKYDFRIAARQAYAPLTWMDEDESGNYDPAHRRRRIMAPITKKRRAPWERSDGEATMKPRIQTWSQGRINGKQLIVTLKVTSETGKAFLRTIGSTLDNWPLPNSCALVKHSSYWSETIDSDCTGSDGFGEGPYQFRKRDPCQFRKISTYNGCDPPDLSEITLGKPEARGCKACLALGVRCPLLDEGSEYPCDECKDADIDCELIMEPQEKRRCEVCPLRKLSTEITVLCLHHWRKHLTADHKLHVRPARRWDWFALTTKIVIPYFLV